MYICDSRGVRDIYDTDGTDALAASEPLAVLVCFFFFFWETVLVCFCVFHCFRIWLSMILNFRIHAPLSLSSPINTCSGYSIKFELYSFLMSLGSWHNHLSLYTYSSFQFSFYLLSLCVCISILVDFIFKWWYNIIDVCSELLSGEQGNCQCERNISWCIKRQ